MRSSRQLDGLVTPNRSKAKKRWRLWCPLIVVLVSITVILAVLMLNPTPPRQVWPDHLSIVVQQGIQNWTLIFTIVPFYMPLNGVRMAIYDDMGILCDTMGWVHMSNLTITNWDIHKALYLKVGSEDSIVVGARIFLNITTYLGGYKYMLADTNNILFSGHLN